MSLSVLDQIIARKRIEVRRMHRFADAIYDASDQRAEADGEGAVNALCRRPDGAVSVIAEVKFRSPSAGVIRAQSPGEAVRVARAYERGGASAVSVLADRKGFAGSAMHVRRVVEATSRPVLFKEFVVDPLQVQLAHAVGASMVLLLVRVLNDSELEALIDEVREYGMEPVVEAADAAELDRAQATSATIVGVNARDLRTFSVDRVGAEALVNRIDSERCAVFMSGVRSKEDFHRLRDTRADAALIGEGLMRATDPSTVLRDWLA